MIRPTKQVQALLTGVILAAMLALVSVPVAAHSLLLKSDPESGSVRQATPEHITAWYSQELESRLSALQVFDVDGRQVDEGDGGVDLNDPDHDSMIVQLPAALPDGVYTVRWMAVSVEDGDQTEGEFTFAIGAE